MAPTVGRIVHFYSDAVANRESRQPGYGYNGMGSGPYPAIVTQVFKDGDRVTYINLKVFPPFAPPFDEGSVSEGADKCPGRYWEWPPVERGTPATGLRLSRFAPGTIIPADKIADIADKPAAPGDAITLIGDDGTFSALLREDGSAEVLMRLDGE